jgi:hypothetical protein
MQEFLHGYFGRTSGNVAASAVVHSGAQIKPQQARRDFPGSCSFPGCSTLSDRFALTSDVFHIFFSFLVGFTNLGGVALFRCMKIVGTSFERVAYLESVRRCHFVFFFQLRSDSPPLPVRAFGLLNIASSIPLPPHLSHVHHHNCLVTDAHWCAAITQPSWHSDRSSIVTMDSV